MTDFKIELKYTYHHVQICIGVQIQYFRVVVYNLTLLGSPFYYFPQGNTWNSKHMLFRFFSVQNISLNYI